MHYAGVSNSLTDSVAANQEGPSGLAVDSSTVYWTNYYGGTVMKVATTGTPVVLAIGQTSPASIAIDSANVYWTANGAVMRTPK